MKRVIFIGLILVLAVGVVFAQQRFRNGTVTVTGTSYDPAVSEQNGSMTVAVTFARNRITNIVISEHTDTQAFVNMVSSQLIPAIISAQSVDVDVVTGATGSSNGLKDAVSKAIEQAKR